MACLCIVRDLGRPFGPRPTSLQHTAKSQYSNNNKSHHDRISTAGTAFWYFPADFRHIFGIQIDSIEWCTDILLFRSSVKKKRESIIDSIRRERKGNRKREKRRVDRHYYRDWEYSVHYSKVSSPRLNFFSFSEILDGNWSTRLAWLDIVFSFFASPKLTIVAAPSVCRLSVCPVPVVFASFPEVPAIGILPLPYSTYYFLFFS